MWEAVRNPSHPGHMVVGLTIWGLWFAAQYAGLSLTCAALDGGAERDPEQIWLRTGLVLLALGVALLLLWLFYRCWKASLNFSGESHHQKRLISRVSAGVNLLLAGATVIVASPAVYLPPCL